MGIVIYVFICIGLIWYYIHLLIKNNRNTYKNRSVTKEVRNVISEKTEPESEPEPEAVEPDYKYHLHVDVAGVFVPRRKNYILEHCLEGDELTLKHDKRNAYSKRAIAIRHDGTLIGYVPEVYCEEVMEILHLDPQCVIKDIYYTGDFLDVYVDIFILEEDELSTD